LNEVSNSAQEASADGINWTFSPMVDVSRDPRWGRVSEGSGEDAYLGSQIAKAMVKGYQQDDLSKTIRFYPREHFALYGASEVVTTIR
jgi:beta-glucosidase